MKRFFTWVLILILLVPLWFHFATGSLPFFFTKPFDIVIKDKETGNPIPGAIVKAEWSRTLVGFEWGGRSKTEYFMSDKDGRVRIPLHVEFTPLSFFSYFSVIVKQPMYLDAGNHYYTRSGKYFGHIHSPNSDEWKINPVKIQMTPLLKKFSNTRCLSFLNENGFPEETCKNVENNTPPRLAVSNSSEYYRIINEGGVKYLKDDFIIPKEPVLALWHEINEIVYEGSKYKPNWDHLFKNAKN